MPWLWKVGMVILVVCLVASMAIGIVRLITTPTEILGDGFHGVRSLPALHAPPGGGRGVEAANRIGGR